jgi:hypothetical protein
MATLRDKFNRFFDRSKIKDQNMLSKIYNLKKNDINYPLKKAYLLYPERLHLTSIDKLPDNVYKLNIGYKTRWSGYITKTKRVNYDQIIKGVIYCDEVLSINKIGFNQIGSIKTSFLSKIKVLNLPVGSSYNIQIKCKIIRFEDIDIFVEIEGRLLKEVEYLELLRIKLNNK